MADAARIPDRRPALAVGVAVVCGLWAIALVPAYQFFAWPRQIDTLSLVAVVRIAAILGLVAGATRIPSAGARLVIAVAVVSVLWCPATAWPAVAARFIAIATGGAACPVAPCLRCSTLLSATGAPGLPDLVLLLAALVLAVWRRAPARLADGSANPGVVPVRWLGVGCLFGGPAAGLAGWLALAPGDIYGGPLGLGVLVGLFGLLVITGHAAFHGLLGGTRWPNLLAPAYGAVVILVPVLYAALSRTLRLG